MNYDKPEVGYIYSVKDRGLSHVIFSQNSIYSGWTRPNSYQCPGYIANGNRVARANYRTYEAIGSQHLINLLHRVLKL